MTNLQRYKRKAAAHVFFHLFSVLTNVSHQMIFNHLNWGEDIFTKKEKRYIEQLRNRVHEDGELCRRLAHRLTSN